MSRLWPKRLRVMLAPAHVEVACRGRMLPDAGAPRALPCRAAGASEAPWAPALETLRGYLAASEAADMEASVVLSNHFVRYVLVPWSALIGSEEEELAYVRYCFANIYGEAAQAWVIRLSPGGRGEPQVACAVDRDLLDGLAQAFHAAGARLMSIQPYLMLAFNDSRHQLARYPSCSFVVAEPGRLNLMLMHEGHHLSLHGMRVGMDWAAELPHLLERELRLHDDEAAPRVLLLWTELACDDAGLGAAGWTVVRLPAAAAAGAGGPREQPAAMIVDG